MAKVSAGILVYRRGVEGLEFLLAHPGGPFWRHKDLGVWTIPKGETEIGEEPLTCALREFAEEIGPPPPGPYRELSPIKQRGGKHVHAWACEGDVDVRSIQGGKFRMQWPPNSGRFIEAPEVDRAEYLGGTVARAMIIAAQIPLLAECEQLFLE